MSKVPPPPPPPPPPPKGGAPRPGGARIFVFLVGVDDYVNIEGVNLRGCVQDVSEIESYLRWRYWGGTVVEERIEEGLTHRSYPLPINFKGWDALEVLTLTNAAATYVNMVTEFRGFLRQALRGDIVWIHFSGLGTSLRSNLPLADNEDRDQAFLCHDANPRQAEAVLTDKELAVLINEITKPSGTPHIAVTIDSWFTAGVGRNEEGGQNSRHYQLNRRFLPVAKREYFKEVSGITDLDSSDVTSGELPTPPRLLMQVRPDKGQSIAENEDGGLFTQKMLEILLETGGEISYEHLTLQTEIALNASAPDSPAENTPLRIPTKRRQTASGPPRPVFENKDVGQYKVELVADGISPSVSFLLGDSVQELRGHAVWHENGNWIWAMGNIHGLPDLSSFAPNPAFADGVEVRIYTHKSSEEVATARLASVHTHFCVLTDIDISESHRSLRPDNLYYGILNYLPVAPLVAQIVTEAGASTDLLALVTDAFQRLSPLNIQLMEQGATPAPFFLVNIGPSSFQLGRQQNGTTTEVKRYRADNQKGFIEDMTKMANWKRLIDLESPAGAVLEGVELAIRANGRLGPLALPEPTPVAGRNEITVGLTAFESIQTSSNDRKFYLRPKVRIPRELAATQSEPLYFYLFELWSWHEISCRDGQRMTQLGEDGMKQGLIEWDESNLGLAYSGFGWGLDGREQRDTVQLKLIVANKEFDYFNLLQTGTKSSVPQEYQYSSVGSSGAESPDDWWYATTLTVHAKRDETEVSGASHPANPAFQEDEELQALGFNIGQRHAFVIGINQYPGLDADLMTARSDAEEVAKRLKVIQGYDNVMLLQDVGKEQLSTLLNWLGDQARNPNGLSIDEIEFNITRPSYKSRIGWLNFLAPEDEVEDATFSLVTGGDDSPNVTHLKLEKQATCEISENDAVVFYFAGHGYPGDVDASITGQLVPTDARKGRTSESGLIEMDFLYQKLSEIDCQHFLLILDCCYAGQFKFANRNRSIASSFLVPIHQGRLQRYLRRKAWQVLVSSGPDEVALDSAELASIRDHSPFAHTLIRALEGDADILNVAGARGKRSGDGVITASELDIYITNQVIDIVDDVQLQQPDLFTMHQDEGGEFLFFTPEFSYEGLGPYIHVPPYKGLHPYEVADRNRFFGREAAITEVLGQMNKLEENEVLFITGASGSGKTSLARAGVAPRLVANPDESIFELRISDLRDDNDATAEEDDDSVSLLATDETPTLSKRQAVEAALDAAGENTLVLIFDQFEDFFKQADQAEIIANINTLLAKAGAQHKVIFTLRSDYEWQMVRDGFFLKSHWKRETIYRVPPMSLKELEEVVTEPAWLALYDFRDSEEETDSRDIGERLINEIVSDFANAPGALPLLSYTMQAFYELVRPDADIISEDTEAADDTEVVLNENTRRFTLSVYEDEIRGVEGMISKRADEVFGNFTAEEQAMTRLIFLRMVEPQEGGFFRRRIYLVLNEAAETLAEDPNNPLNNELVFRDEAKRSLAYKVIKELEEAHLLVIDDPVADGINTTYIEPAHDALLTHWGKCLEWIEAFGVDMLALQRNLWEVSLEDEERSGEDGSSVALRDMRFYEPEPEDKLVDHRSLTAFEEAVTLAPLTSLWDSNPKLMEVINSVIFIWEEESIDDFLQEITDEEQQARYRAFLEKCQEKKQVPDLDPFVLNGHSTELLRILLERGKHWLNLREDDFIQRSWQARTDRILRLIQQRNEARSAALAAQARQVRGNDHTIALNLALEANDLAPTPESEAVLRDILSRPNEIFYHKQFKYQTQLRSMALSPDGEKLIVGTRFGHLVTTEPQGDRVLTEFLGHADQLSSDSAFPDNNASVRSLAYSPVYGGGDAPRQYIVSGSRNNRAKVWDAATLDNVFTEEYETDINAIAFHPADSLVAIASKKDGKGCVDVLRMKDDNSIEEVFRHSEGGKGVKSVAFSPDGEYLISGWNDDKARIVKLNRANLAATNYADDGYSFRRTNDDEEILSLAFIPKQEDDDRLLVVTGSSDNTAVIWWLDPDNEEAEVLRVLEGHSENVISVIAFEMSGKRYVLTGSIDNTARLWDVETGLQLLKFIDHSGDIEGVAFTANGDQVYTASRDRTVKCWYLDGTMPEHILTGHQGSVRAVAFDPAGNRVLTGSADETARVWSLSGGTAQFELARHRGEVTAVAFSPDGQFIATGSKDDKVMIWNATDGEHLITLDLHATTVIHVAFSEDSSEIYSVSQEFVKITWPVDTAKWEAGEAAHTAIVTGFDKSALPPVDVAFSADDRMIITIGGGNTAMVWANVAKDRRAAGYIYQLSDEEREGYDIDMNMDY